jgi:hypothetical protein
MARHRPLDARRTAVIVGAMIAIGVAGRIVVAFATFGDAYDIPVVDRVGAIMRHHPLDLYRSGIWPYSPLYAVWPAVAEKVAQVFSIAFHGVVQLPPITADAILAYVVWRWAASEGRTLPQQIAAVALVAFGPIFALISGYQGQFDSLAILPALLGCMVWTRNGEARDLKAGLLIGLGAALKTIPGLMLLAVLPTARTAKEAVRVCLAAAVPMLIVLAPYVVHDAGDVVHRLRYTGIPGIGGLSLVVQPSYADAWGKGQAVVRSGASDLLNSWSPVISAVAIGAVAVVLRRRRIQALDAAVVLWVAVLVFGSNFFFQYLLWLLPFLIVTHRLRWAAALQLAAIGPAVIFYKRPLRMFWLVDAYKVVMIGLWVVGLIVLAFWVRRLLRDRQPSLAVGNAAL